jgi:hypothetical protein
MVQKPKKRGRGQPPKGPHGELVSKYPPVTVRIPPMSKDQLEALSTLRAVPMWRLVDEAVRALVNALPEAERRLVVQMAHRRGLARPESS